MREMMMGGNPVWFVLLMAILIFLTWVGGYGLFLWEGGQHKRGGVLLAVALVGSAALLLFWSSVFWPGR